MSLKQFIINSKKINDIDAALYHLKYAVDKLEFNTKQKIWICFLYGLTYHLPSALALWNEFPDAERLDLERFNTFYRSNYKSIPFQVDKLKSKAYVESTISDYITQISVGQVEFIQNYSSFNPIETFNKFWNEFNSVAHYARFSIWNFTQALKFLGLIQIQPSNVLLGKDKSIAFIDGLLYDLGHLEKLTKKIDGKKQYYQFSDDEKQFYEEYAQELCKECNIDIYELETISCAYKKLYRNNDSRYCGYYNDRIYEEIKQMESIDIWKGVDYDILWRYRVENDIPNRPINRTRFKEPLEQKIQYKSSNNSFDDF